MNAFAQALITALNYAIVSKEIIENNKQIGFICHEEAVFEQDSGWRFFSGFESDEYCRDSHNFVSVPLREIVAMHSELSNLIKEKSLGAWAWHNESNQFIAVLDWL